MKIKIVHGKKDETKQDHNLIFRNTRKVVVSGIELEQFRLDNSFCRHFTFYNESGDRVHIMISSYDKKDLEFDVPVTAK